jgi:hypothetical protein
VGATDEPPAELAVSPPAAALALARLLMLSERGRPPPLPSVVLVADAAARDTNIKQSAVSSGNQTPRTNALRRRKTIGDSHARADQDEASAGRRTGHGSLGLAVALLGQQRAQQRHARAHFQVFACSRRRRCVL